MRERHAVREGIVVLLAMTVLSACGAPATEDAATPRQPNVVLILADDIGVETVGAYGSAYSTPSIDSIAQNGVRFDAAHATPICTPSRVRLLTGRYSIRNYVDFAVLRPGEQTLATRLRDVGYRTLVAGKWQLAGTGDEGDPPGVSPEAAGFDEHLVWYMRRASKGSRYWGPRLFDNGTLTNYEEGEFGPLIVNRRVTDFIASAGNRPFFVYYPMMLAHKEWVTTPVSLDAETDQDRFVGMMAYMDILVGNVLDSIRDAGIDDNTVVMFIGDNGTHPEITSLQNGMPVQGGKWLSNRRGTHVPFVVQWPGVLGKGIVSDALVDLVDVMPTILSFAASDVPAATDGIELFSDGRVTTNREWIHMHFDPYRNAEKSNTVPSRFVFDKHYKLYGDGRFFDLEADPEEQRDLASTELGDDARRAHDKLAGVFTEIGQRKFFHESNDPAGEAL